MIEIVLTISIIILVLIVTTIIFKLNRKENDYSKKQQKLSSYYVLSHIIIFFIITPFTLQYFPGLFSVSSQIWISVILLILDWVSLYEDKSRFSEAQICLLGNCRKNALYTGVLANLGDSLALFVLLYSVLGNKTSHKVVVSIFGLAYSLYGSYFIYNFTKDSSESDLRKVSEKDKCSKNRIMKDTYRGNINLVITILGVIAGWQSIMSTSPRLKYNNIFTSWLYELMKIFKGNSNLQGSSYTNLLRSTILIVIAIIPSLPNHINTAFQYTADPTLLKLPKCFD